ncbi:hypothetical protein [Falsirhodobacter sp. 1013]|uniref:hypothetical protein n=1 Tax=Falsirhodobacter sp. 1013 TaxID=3417566 RepID=UPI003EBBFF9D
MKVRLIAAVVIASALTTCGSTAPNTNASDPINLAGSTSQDTSGVQVVQDAPPNAVEIAGIDCRNKVWSPTPTGARAIEALKSQAKQAGYSKVMVRSLRAVDQPIAINCWSAMEAKGLAY